MKDYTLYDIVSSILDYKRETVQELAKQLNISELQLARELSKNKTIHQDFLIKIFTLLDVSLIDNVSKEVIPIHTIDDILSNAMNNINFKNRQSEK